MAVNGKGTTNLDKGSYTYELNKAIDLKAEPDTGWVFEKWVVNGKDIFTPEITLIMDQNIDIEARFSEHIQRSALTVRIEGQGTTNPQVGTHQYLKNIPVFLTATPADDWAFEKWVVGGTEYDTPTINLIMDTDKWATAHFKEGPKTLTIGKVGQGTTDPGVGTHSYDHGSLVFMTATPADDWFFQKWVYVIDGRAYTSESETLVMLMNQNQQATAYFTKLPDFWVQRVEFNQAIQSFETGQNVAASRLVAGKRTAVRVYVAGKDNDINPKQITAVLHIYKDGSPVAGSPFSPQPMRITPVLNPSRTAGDWNDRPRETLQFYPPTSALSEPGTYQYFIMVDPNYEVQEATRLNNRFPASGFNSFVLHDREVFNVLAFWVDTVDREGNPVNTWDGTDHLRFQEGRLLTRSYFPVPNVSFAGREMEWNLDPAGALWWRDTGGDLSTQRGMRRLLAHLVDLMEIENSNGNNYHTVVAMLPRGTQLPSTDTGRVVGFANVGNPGALALSEPISVLAHELGHNWLRWNAFPDSPRGDRNHDHTNSRNDGFDVLRRELRLNRPSFMFNTVMNNPWTTPAAYSAFFSNNRLGLASAEMIRAASRQEVEALRISGIIDDNVLEMSPIQTIQAGEFTPDDPQGSYLLELQDANRVVLSSLRFQPWVTETAEGEKMSITSGYFSLIVPRPPGLKYIVVKSLETSETMGTVTVSAHPPTVQVLSPRGGETVSGRYTVKWEASDPDGDPLVYTVLYSHDGTRWGVLANYLTGTSYQWDTSKSPGGTNARIRVIATDGVNTASDVSAPFTVAVKPPEAFIVAPEDGARDSLGAMAVFVGAAYDLEDGELSGEQLSWSSSIDGPLGTGESLATTALSLGTHTVTLTATDSDGNTARDTITFTVVEDPLEGPRDEDMDTFGARHVRMTIGSTEYEIDGVKSVMDTAPFIEESRTFVPVRYLAEAFNAVADWTPKDARVETVTLERSDLLITINIGAYTIEVYDKITGKTERVPIDAPARIVANRTFLPFRAVGEAFGADVGYSTDPGTGRVDQVWFTQTP